MVYTQSLMKQGIVSKGRSSLQYVHCIRSSSTTTTAQTKTAIKAASAMDIFLASLAQRASPKSVLNVPRPLTAFSIFQKENFAKLKQENPNAKDSELTKLLSHRWNAGTVKQEFTKKALSLQKDFEKHLADKLALRKKLEGLHAPISGFNLFVKEKAPSMMGKGIKSIAQVAAQWKNLTPDQKQKYMAIASKMHKEMAERKAKMSAEEVIALRELAIEKKVNRLKRLGRRMRRQQHHELATKYNRPKRPAVLVSAFIKQQLSALPKGKKLDLKAFVARWKSMPAPEKQKWLDHYKTAIGQYKSQLAAWEKKMIADGHKDIVNKFHVLKWKSYLPEGVKMPKTIKQYFREVMHKKGKRELKAKRAGDKKGRKQLKLAKQRKIAAMRRQLKRRAAALQKMKALAAKKKTAARKLKLAMAAKKVGAIRKLRLQKQKAAALKKSAVKSKKTVAKRTAGQKKPTKKVMAKKTAVSKAKMHATKKAVMKKSVPKQVKKTAASKKL